MNQSVKKGSNKWLLFALATTVIMMLYAYFVLGYFSQCYAIEDGPNAIGLMFGYSVEDVIYFLSARSKEQLICYSRFIRIWDNVFPVLYTMMHICWIIYLFKKWKLLIVIPILHLVDDWAENTVEIMIVEIYLASSNVSESLVSIGSTLTTSKWILSIVIYMIILVAIGFKVKAFFDRKKVA
jgi:hypothetical protein